MVSFTVSSSLALLAAVAPVMGMPARLDDPTQCTTLYHVQGGDSCAGLVDTWGNLTAVDLLKWNPHIGLKCALQQGEYICINVPGYTYAGPTPGGAIFTAEQMPAPVMYDTRTDICTKYEFTSGTTPLFGELLASNGITEDQWNSWNWPSRNTTGAVFNKYFSCVAVKPSA